MKRWILFILSVAVMYYVALIYHSTSMLFLVCAILLLIVCLFVHNVIVFRKIGISLKTPVTIAEMGNVIPIELVLTNKSHLPAGQVRVRIQIIYSMAGKKKNLQMRSVIHGRKIGQDISKGQLNLKFNINPQYSGEIIISIKRAQVLDLFGILPLPLRKKNIVAQSSLVVLPEKQAIPLMIDRMVQNFAISQETELRISGEKNPPEIAQIREYRPGDSLRNIHWKLTAKRDELMVCEHISEQGCPIVFFVDFRLVTERFWTVFYSIGMELLRQKFSYYLVYYALDTGELVRVPIMGEEDFYELLLLMNMTGQRKKKQVGSWRFGRRRRKGKANSLADTLHWEEEYREKYRQISYAVKLVLWQNLTCTYNDEVIWEEGRNG